MPRIIADTFEEGDREPVVRHIFHGKTRAEARRIMKAHMKSDKFLRDCTTHGKFGAIACRTRVKWDSK